MTERYVRHFYLQTDTSSDKIVNLNQWIFFNVSLESISNFAGLELSMQYFRIGS